MTWSASGLQVVYVRRPGVGGWSFYHLFKNRPTYKTKGKVCRPRNQFAVNTSFSADCAGAAVAFGGLPAVPWRCKRQKNMRSVVMAKLFTCFPRREAKTFGGLGCDSLHGPVQPPFFTKG
jgi:hypothetical protein